MLEVRVITIDINSNILNEFFRTCEYLHKIKKMNCFYNKSVPFQFIIKQFNKNKSIQNLSIYDTYNVEKIKKDKQRGFCIDKDIYDIFLNNCSSLNVKPRPMIRTLMNKTIKTYY